MNHMNKTISGDRYIKHCRNFVAHVESGGRDTYEDTFCAAFVVGAAEALSSTDAICIVPANAAWIEHVKIVIAYADRLPPRLMSDKLGTIVTAALIRGWPCKKGENR
jgi:hypothetical protein